MELLREPGGAEVSERIRALVKDPALAISPRAEALLYAAARAQLVEERLEPLLREGVVVLLDRFVDSSLAYQGAGRALGDRGGTRDQPVRHRLDWRPSARCSCGSLPPPAVPACSARAVASDRLERESESFFATIANAYEELARAEPQRIRPIDATQPPERVLRDALAALDDLLERSPPDLRAGGDRGLA